jgi:hypothetical protein
VRRYDVPVLPLCLLLWHAGRTCSVSQSVHSAQDGASFTAMRCAGIPACEFRLICGARQLEHGFAAAHYGIQRDAILVMKARMLGGLPGSSNPPADDDAIEQEHGDDFKTPRLVTGGGGTPCTDTRQRTVPHQKGDADNVGIHSASALHRSAMRNAAHVEDSNGPMHAACPSEQGKADQLYRIEVKERGQIYYFEEEAKLHITLKDVKEVMRHDGIIGMQHCVFADDVMACCIMCWLPGPWWPCSLI